MLINRLYNWIARRTIKASEHNQEFNQIHGIINGGIENINVKQNAGIRQDQGKLVLDYDAIAAALIAAGFLDGLEPTFDNIPYAENTLIVPGYFNNIDPATFPVVVPADTFEHFMLVYWGASAELSSDQDTTAPHRKIELHVNTNDLPNASNGNIINKVSEGEDSFNTILNAMGPTYIQMTDSANNYTAAIPLLVSNQQHEFDVVAVEVDGETPTLTNKHIHIFGR